MRAVKYVGCGMLFFAVAMPSSSTSAQTIDLGRQATDAAPTVSVEAGTVLRVVLRNRIPFVNYSVSVERRTIAVPELTAPAGVVPAAAQGCKELKDLADKVTLAEDETEVADVVEAVEAALSKQQCTDVDALSKINAVLLTTVGTVPDSWTLSVGEELVVTVKRTLHGKSKTWQTVFSTGPRGRWLTTYGLGTFPNQDRKYFAKAAGNGKFIVTPETEPGKGDLKITPMALFTWLPRAREAKNFAAGLTGGLGVKEDAPVAFLGGGFLYNWNLAVVAGVAVAHRLQLDGKYTKDQELGETLSTDQLNQKVYRPTWMAAITYRFGSSPFGSGSKPPTSSASPSPSPSATPSAKTSPAATGGSAAPAPSPSPGT